jgi:hypothetical protein
MLFDDGMIEHDEYQIYNKWFDEFLDDMCLGGIIYVKADPEICAERVKLRAREGETIPLEYLQKCHKYHEDWLETNTDKLVIEANIDTSVTENAIIREQWIQSVDNWIIRNFTNTCLAADATTDTTADAKHISAEYNRVKREFSKDVSKCTGCSPRFQENQMAHMGENGCIDYC